jgi:hypothetical protein
MKACSSEREKLDKVKHTGCHAIQGVMQYKVTGMTVVPYRRRKHGFDIKQVSVYNLTNLERNKTTDKTHFKAGHLLI